MTEITIAWGEGTRCASCLCPLPAGAPAWMDGDEPLCCDCAGGRAPIGAAISAQIRTSDKAWAARHGKPGPEDRTIVAITDPEPVTFCGKQWIRFTLAAGTAPRDWPVASARGCMAPAEWTEGVRLGT
jgi:hypothetical protein